MSCMVSAEEYSKKLLQESRFSYTRVIFKGTLTTKTHRWILIEASVSHYHYLCMLGGIELLIFQ